ncbi:MAG: hypothetical protein AAF430_06060 [Myxococcota bacterium]
MTHPRSRLVLFVIALVPLVSEPAVAASIEMSETLCSPQRASVPIDDVSDAGNPATCVARFATNEIFATATAQAGFTPFGGLAVSSASAAGGQPLAQSIQGTAASSYVVDVVLSGPAASVSTSLNGFLDVQTLTGSGQPGLASVFFDMGLVGAQSALFYQEGCLNRASCAGIVSSRSELLPVGVPLSIQVRLIGVALTGILGQPGNSTVAVTAFAHPDLDAVFDLPAGFTANSTDGSIVDNRWMGSVAELEALAGSIAVDPIVIPEPSTGALVALGVALLGARSRLRR